VETNVSAGAARVAIVRFVQDQKVSELKEAKHKGRDFQDFKKFPAKNKKRTPGFYGLLEHPPEEEKGKGKGKNK
jgi:hypothetical protein